MTRPLPDPANHADLADQNLFADFVSRTVMLNGTPRTVHVAGTGPAVIILHELPGIGAHLLRFARWVRDAGFTVFVPSLFGVDGANPSADEGAQIFRRACVNTEFRALGAGATSPVTMWLRALARLAHAECGGVGVGAVGMCFTGNFALTMMLEHSVLAPIVSQPSLPFDVPGGLEIAPSDLVAIRSRLDREQLTVLAYRFAGDRFCTAARFAAYADALGDRFIGRVLPDDAANLDDAPPFFATHVNGPHSVVTVHLVDEAGSPTVAARDEMIAFLRERLTPSGIYARGAGGQGPRAQRTTR
jgi:dienelactone hydrolase